MISYAYCKWETRIQVHCDCEKVLMTDEHQNTDQMAKWNHSIKTEDPIILADENRNVEITILPEQSDHLSVNTLTGFPAASFHPPSQV